MVYRVRKHYQVHRNRIKNIDLLK